MEPALARDRARLLELLTQLSFERRRVVLSSGKESDFYIDCKRTALTAEGHFLIGRLLFDAIRRELPGARAVGGLTLGADPIASAVSLTSYLAGQPIPAFIVRKEPKGHGTGAWIEGRSLLEAGAVVAVVEDVVTTGASTLKAFERAAEEGLSPRHAFALVDRLEGGREAVEARGHRLTALFTRRDFLPEEG
jgi:orotate phosphoribosyltransferase